MEEEEAATAGGRDCSRTFDELWSPDIFTKSEKT